MKGLQDTCHTLDTDLVVDLECSKLWSLFNLLELKLVNIADELLESALNLRKETAFKNLTFGTFNESSGKKRMPFHCYAVFELQSYVIVLLIYMGDSFT